MVLATLVGCLLGATGGGLPEVAVVLTRREGLSAPESVELLARVEESLALAGLSGALPVEELASRLEAVNVSDTASCEARRECAVDLGGLLRVPVVVAVELGALRRVWAVHLEVLRVADGKTLASLDQALSRKDPSARLEDLAGLVSAANAATSASAAPAAASDAPVAEGSRLVPGFQLSAVTTRALYGLRRKTVGTGTAIAGAALLGTSLAFLFVGRGQEAVLASRVQRDGSVLIAVSRDRAQASVDAANLSYTLALTSGLLAGALGVLSAWLFATDDISALDD